MKNTNLKLFGYSSYQIGHLKVNLNLISGHDSTIDIITWNHWLCSKIINDLISKYKDTLDATQKYQLCYILRDDFNRIIEGKTLQEYEIPLLTELILLSDSRSISSQIPQFQFFDDSFLSHNIVILLCVKNDIFNQNISISSTNGSYNGKRSIPAPDNSKDKGRMYLPWEMVHEDDDLVNLSHLDDYILLNRLHQRYKSGLFYTLIDKILIFMNPNCSLPIYNPKFSNLYRNHRFKTRTPHIYGITDHVYYHMLETKSPQCILISGESGSGKTETSKQILKHLTFLSDYQDNSKLIPAILASSNVLEAFGNASNSQNKNSSRFVKLTEIQFSPNGCIIRANIKIHLLEKNRLITRHPNERNFHIFYFLLSESKEQFKDRLSLLSTKDYNYLIPSDQFDENENIYLEFKKFKDYMKDLNFSKSIQSRIFEIIVAILYIGNFNSEKDTGDCITIAANLLKIDKKVFETLLLSQCHTINNEKIVSFYSKPRIKTVRDSVSKMLYSMLFDWIVKRINRELGAGDLANAYNPFTIKVLDVFGIENMEENSFEQFCINYVNEALQMFMNDITFKLKQEEYKDEVVQWNGVNFYDNSNVVYMMAGKPNGLIQLIEDECRLRDGTDSNLLRNFTSFHKNHEAFSIQGLKSHQFLIKHYAGDVIYSINGFRDKNINHINSDFVNLLLMSKCYLVRNITNLHDYFYSWRAAVRAILFLQRLRRNLNKKNSPIKEEKISQTTLSVNERSSLQSEKGVEEKRASFSKRMDSILDKNDYRRIFSQYKTTLTKDTLSKRKSISYPESKKIKINFDCISSFFYKSTNELIDDFTKCECFFIKCIKPNEKNNPLSFDRNKVMVQLKYTGIIETIMIRQLDFPFRFDKNEFLHEYRLLFDNLTDFTQVDQYLKSHQIEEDLYQIGKSKIFLKSKAVNFLDAKQDKKFMQYLTKIQLAMKSFLLTRHQWNDHYTIKNFLQTVHNLILFRQYQYSKGINDNESKNIKDNLSLQIPEEVFLTAQSSLTHEDVSDDSSMSRYAESCTDSKVILPNKWVSFSTVFKIVSKNINKNTHDSLKGNKCQSFSMDDINQLNEKNEEFLNRFIYKAKTETDTVSEVDALIKNRFSDIETSAVDQASHEEIVKNIIGSIIKRNSSSKKSKINFIEKLINYSKNAKINKSEKPVNKILVDFTSNDELLSQEQEYVNYYLFWVKKAKSIIQYPKAEEKVTKVKHIEEIFYNVFVSYASVIYEKIIINIKENSFKKLTLSEANKYFEDSLEKYTADSQNDETTRIIIKNAFDTLLSEFYTNKSRYMTNKNYVKIYKEIKTSLAKLKNHYFKPYKVYAVTFCEVCNTQINHEGILCQQCHVLTHRECVGKIKVKCLIVTKVPTKFFGINIHEIVDRSSQVSIKLDMLLLSIESRSEMEGIYRKAGNPKQIKELRDLLEQNINPQSNIFDNYNVHALCSVVKGFLRELLCPVVDDAFSSDISLAINAEHPVMYHMLWKVVSSLPILNKQILDIVICHLAKICACSDKNKMTSENIAIIFTPCLFKESQTNISQYLISIANKTKFIEFLIDFKIYCVKKNTVSNLEIPFHLEKFISSKHNEANI